MIAVLLRLMPSWAWGAVLGLAIAAGLTLWHVDQVRAARLAGRAEVQARWDAERAQLEAAAKAAQAANQAETQRRIVDQQEISNEAQRQSALARSHADAARDALERLRIRAAAAPGGGCAAADPAPASPGQAASDAAGLPSDVLGRLGQAARRYAAIADERGIAGAACERDYDALIAPKPGAGLPGGAMASDLGQGQG